MLTLIAPFIGLVGVIIGALIQFHISRNLEQRRHQRETRTRAYADYISCVCSYANLRYDRQSDERRALAARTADAKCRVCLYGSPRVIEMLAKFERLGAAMNTDEQCNTFINMVIFMRNDSTNNAGVDFDDLHVIVLGGNKN